MVLVDILLNIGIGTIDDNLVKLIEAMKDFPQNGPMNDIQNWAKIIGLCIALGVGSYECWMMMLGRRGMDVMKILRIVIISICISSSSWICEAARGPGDALAQKTHAMAEEKNNEVKNLESQITDEQTKYYNQLRQVLLQAEMQKQNDIQQNGSAPEKTLDTVLEIVGLNEFMRNMEYRIKSQAITLETKITEWISIAIRFIGEVIFQMAYYGMLVAQAIFMVIMQCFCPIVFAISLAPPFRSAWSQWLSKYISLSLWGFIIYLILYYSFFIMQYALTSDLEEYEKLTNGLTPGSHDMTTILGLGMQGLGTTCMYVVGLLVGVFLLRFVPEVASWLIPGGTSSGVGGMASAVSGTIINASKTTVQGASGVATGGASAIGGQAAKNLGGAVLSSAKVTG